MVAAAGSFDLPEGEPRGASHARALRLPPPLIAGARVALISARPLAETASYWAQGGLAAASCASGTVSIESPPWCTSRFAYRVRREPR